MHPPTVVRLFEPPVLAALERVRARRGARSCTAVLRELVLEADGSLEAPPPDPLPAFLDAWEALCAAKGATCLRAGEAVQAAAQGGSGVALADALHALGYPRAMNGPAALGAALRRLRGRRAGPTAAERWLGSSRSGGVGIWYVSRTVDGPSDAAS